MQTFGATAVALSVLCGADQFLSAGRYTEAVSGILRHALLAVGIHV
jgi:hypothetical protein